jgi:hypothetical protein
MNIRKHLAGFAIFCVILGSAIFINYFLTLPNATIPPVPLRPPVAGIAGSTEAVTYKVQQVTLNFINNTTHIALSFKLLPGQPVPEKLWVTTFYFSPDSAMNGWSTTTEIPQPFGRGNQAEFVATDSSDFSVSSDEPRIAYFARVYVWAGYDDNSYPPGVQFDRDITQAEPVVVHWPDERLSANTTEKFSR